MASFQIFVNTLNGKNIILNDIRPDDLVDTLYGMIFASIPLSVPYVLLIR